MYNGGSSFLVNIVQGFYLCSVVPRVLRQHWTVYFAVQYCLKRLGQHCARILPVQCCPKGIKVTMNNTFSWPLLSGACWTRILPVQCCPKSIKTSMNRISPVQVCLKSIETTLNRNFPLKCCPEPLGQYCTRILPVQCCPKGIKITMNNTFSW